MPQITKPTAQYTGHYIDAILKSGTHDHTDLSRALLTAFVDARILVAIEPGGDELEDTYFPLAGRLRKDSNVPAWTYDLIQYLTKVSDSDRQIVTDLARRLAHG